MAKRPAITIDFAALILLAVVIPSFVSGQCTFPSVTTGNWYWTTVLNNEGFFWVLSYQAGTERFDAVDQANATTSLFTIENTCSNGGAVGDKYCHTVSSSSGPLCSCIETVEYSIFAQRVRAFGAPTPEECSTMIQTNSPDGMLYPFIKLSGSNFDYSATPACPFTTGNYRTDVFHSGASQCYASRSESSVTGNSLALNSCLSTSHSYATPSAANLICVASFDGAVMDSNDNGGILLLADMTNTLLPQYYCSRYKEESGTVYLSLATTPEFTRTTCPYNQTFASSDTTNGFYGFILTSTTATTASDEPETESATLIILGVLLACAIATIFVFIFVILLRRNRDQNKGNELMATDVVIPIVNEATGNGIEGTTSNTPGTDPVYEVIVDEDAVSPVPNGHTYENQTPSGRSRPFNGQGSITGEISQQTPSDPAITDEGENGYMVPKDHKYESIEGSVDVLPGTSNGYMVPKDHKYESIESRVDVLPGTSNHVYANQKPA